ncbi:hypothetical protein SAMN05444583_10944 [Rhodococcus maanshanensis]|uniref:Uncharacterized protein n=1 Tax=Rhodococcus maanshanensis TaxID=183556 RepID=A0A1H7Q5A0_9NOCA|nr:hypothetical protein SAMN05444583_10944 [Rhodococcus maanshanensis]
MGSINDLLIGVLPITGSAFAGDHLFETFIGSMEGFFE